MHVLLLLDYEMIQCPMYGHVHVEGRGGLVPMHTNTATTVKPWPMNAVHTIHIAQTKACTQ